MKTIGYDNLEYLEICSNNEKRKKKQKLEIGQFNSNSKSLILLAKLVHLLQL